MSAPHPPRKGAYTKHVSALHKDQFIRIQAKNSQELELLDQMHSYMKKRTAIERKSAEEMLKLNTAYLNHKIIPIPDIGNPMGKAASEEQGARNNTEQEINEVNVFTAWRQLLEENEKISKARLAAVQVYIEDVEKDAKALKASKQAQTKKCLERIQVVQKDLQESISEVDRTRRTYFSEESDALQTGSKAKDADEKARGKKKDVASFFQSTKALRKKAGNLSVKQEELDIKSTGARNDYILGLATANAHQEQYFKHDLQDLIKTLEAESFEKIKSYIDTVARTELLTCSAVQISYTNIKNTASRISRGHNYRCYLKAYPSLAEHVTYQQEFVQGDDISVITSSEHDGGYSLNYEARRNASKLNQSVKTAKAYRKRIDACYYHLSKGLKKEPNDTNGPDLTTKIKELQIAIRNAERERAKSEARIAKLKEGGINVDEYIDACVYEVEEPHVVPGANRDIAAANTDWGDNESNNEQQQDSEDFNTTMREEQAAPTNDGTNGEWSADFAEWGKDTAQEEPQGDGWANWGESSGNDQQNENLNRQASLESSNKVPEPPAANDSTGWAGDNQWGSFDNQNQQSAAESYPTDTTGQSSQGPMQEIPTGSLKAVALYEFVSQNQDELTVTETEEVYILPGECDEEGWLMVMNSAGSKGYVPQNYLEVEGAESSQAIDQVVAASQQQYPIQDDYSSQSNGNWGANSYGYPPAMEAIPEQVETSSANIPIEETEEPQFVPYEAPPHPLMAVYEAPPHPLEVQKSEEKSSSEDEEEYSSSVGDNTESFGPPPGLPPPPGPPPNLPPLPPPPPAVSVQDFTESFTKSKAPGRPPSINFAKFKSCSMDSSCASDFPKFCKALYDYEKTGSDEISFEEEDVIRILKREPNGVDDGWWLGEIRIGENEGQRGLFPSIMVEECNENGDSPDDSSITSPPSFAPPSFDAPGVPSALLPPEKIMIINPTPDISLSEEPESELESKDDAIAEKQLPKQETVDSVADIPKDMDSSTEEIGDKLEKGKRIGNLESVEETSDANEIDAPMPTSTQSDEKPKEEPKKPPVIEPKLLKRESANEMLPPSMEVVVTAPTPTVQSPISEDSEHSPEKSSSSSHHEDHEIEMESPNKDKSDSTTQKTQSEDINLHDVEEKLEMHQETLKREGVDSKESIKSSENWFTAEEDTPIATTQEPPKLNESDASLDKRSSYTDSEADSEPLAAVGLTRQANTMSDESSSEQHERRLQRKSTSDSSDFSLGPRAANPQEIQEIKPVSQDQATIPTMCSQTDNKPIDGLRRQSTEKESESLPKSEVSKEENKDDDMFMKDPHNAPSDERKRQYLEKFQRQSTDDPLESENLTSMVSEEKKDEDMEPFRRQSTKSSSSETESETSNKKIRRVSSSDDDSSSEEAATNKDIDDDKSSSTDTEVPQPPDELELKQLKRLETMKESPA